MNLPGAESSISRWTACACPAERRRRARSSATRCRGVPASHGDGRVVLVKQFRYPSREILLELPAGKIDPGESPAECIGRELAEETGWRAAGIHELGSFLTTPGFSDEVLHAFVATALQPAPDITPDPDEAIEIVTMDVGEAMAACRNGQIRDGKTLATFFLAQLNGWI